MKKYPEKKKKALATRPSNNPILECLNNTKDFEHVFLKIIEFSSNLAPEEADQLLLVPRSNNAVPLLNQKYFNIIKQCQEILQDDKMPLYHMISKYIEHPQQNDSQLETEIRVVNILYFIRYKICTDLSFYTAEIKIFNIPLTLQSDLTQRLYKILLKLLPANESPINLSEHQENMQLIEKYRVFLERVSREDIILLHCKNLIDENKIQNRHLELISKLILLKIRLAFCYMHNRPSVAFKATHEAIMIFNYFKKFIEPTFSYAKEMKQLLEDSQMMSNSDDCLAFFYNEVESHFDLAKQQAQEDDVFSDESFTEAAEELYKHAVTIHRDTTTLRSILEKIPLFKEIFNILNRCDKNINNPQIVLLLPCVRHVIEIFSKNSIHSLKEEFYRIALTELFHNISDNIRNIENAYIPKNDFFNGLIKNESLCHNAIVPFVFWLYPEVYSLILENYVFELNREIRDNLNEPDKFCKIQQQLIKGDHFINAIFFFVNLACKNDIIEAEIFCIKFLDIVSQLFIINYEIYMKKLIIGEYYNQFFERLLLYTCIINDIEIFLGKNQRLELLIRNENKISSNNIDVLAMIMLNRYCIFSKFSDIFLSIYGIFINKFMMLKAEPHCRKNIQEFLYKSSKSFGCKKINPILQNEDQNCISLLAKERALKVVFFLNKIFEFKENFYLAYSYDEGLPFLESETSPDITPTNILDEVLLIRKQIEELAKKPLEQFLTEIDLLLNSCFESFENIIRMKEAADKKAYLVEVQKVILILSVYFKKIDWVNDIETILINQLQEKLKEIVKFIIEKKIEIDRLQPTNNANPQIYLTNHSGSPETKCAIIQPFAFNKNPDPVSLAPPKDVTQISQAISERSQKRIDLCVQSLMDQHAHTSEVKPKRRPNNRLRELAKSQIGQHLRDTSSTQESKAKKVTAAPLRLQNSTETDNALLLIPAKSEEERKEERRRNHARQERGREKSRFSIVQTQTRELSRNEKKRQEKRARKEKKEQKKALRQCKKTDTMQTTMPSTSPPLHEVDSLTTTMGSLTLTNKQNTNVIADEKPKNHDATYLDELPLEDEESESLDVTSFDTLPPLSESFDVASFGTLPPLVDEEPESPDATSSDDTEDHYFLSFPNDYPEPVNAIFAEFKSTEGDWYIHGGYLRDTFCGVKENDYDFVTSCSKEELVKHGFVQCPFKGKENLYQRDNIDVMWYPKLSPHHLKVLAGQADISLNSFYADKMRRIMDFEGTYTDIKLVCIKCCDDLEARIQYDPNLILRIIRIANHINKKISPDDLAIMKKWSPLLIRIPFNVYLKSINDLFSRREGYKNYLTLLNEEFLGALQLAASPLERLDFEDFIEDQIKTIDITGNDTEYKKNIAYSIIALLLFRKILCETKGIQLSNLNLFPEIVKFLNIYQGEFLDKDKATFQRVILRKMKNYLKEYNLRYTTFVTYTPCYEAYGSPYQEETLPIRMVKHATSARYTQ